MRFGGAASAPTAGVLACQWNSDPLKTLVRSRKPYRVADEVRNRKRLDGVAVKQDSEGGVHPGEVVRLRHIDMHTSQRFGAARDPFLTITIFKIFENFLKTFLGGY